MMWEVFQRKLEKYFPLSARNKLADALWFRQGNLPIEEYIMKFESLSRYLKFKKMLMQINILKNKRFNLVGVTILTLLQKNICYLGCEGDFIPVCNK